MKVTRPVLRYHGAKFRLAQWILGFFPAHRCYVEPFGGAAGVLLQKPRAYAEVYNDLDGDIVNFFRVLRDPATRAQLEEACALTPYARDEFDLAFLEDTDPIERARRLAVRAQMGFGAAGATMGTTGLRIDTRREYSTSMHLWAEYPAWLADAGQRLAGVLIENRPAVDVMQQHDSPETLHFVDPPYVLSARGVVAAGRRYYRHELSDDDHADLIEVLHGLQGMVVLSGYDTDLYRDALEGWETHRTSSRISAGRGTGLRTEVVWLNAACSAALARGHGGLFAEQAA